MKKLMCVILAVLMTAGLCGCVKNTDREKETTAEKTETVPVTTGDVTTQEVTTEEVTTEEVTTEETTEAPETLPPETESPETDPPAPPPVVPTEPAVINGSLFIGDSRTVGLEYYADIGGADFFASTGMNVMRVLTDVLFVESFGDTTLDGLLKARSYEKIYVMLGINEIGYDHSFVERKFGEVLDAIRAAQPDAVIYIEANLRIVRSRSDTDPIYNNTQMNDLNSRMASFADGDRIRYIDVNPLYDDGAGNLDYRYTFDDFHLQSQYYPQWGAWLAEVS